MEATQKQPLRLRDRLRSPFKKIRTKLILYYLVFMIVPISLVLFFVFNVTIDIMKDEVLGYVLSTLDQANYNVDEVVERLMNQTTRVCVDSEVQGVLRRRHNATQEEMVDRDDRLSDIIVEYMSDIPNLESFYIFGYDGAIYRMKDAKSSLRYDYTFTSADWYKKMKKLNLSSMLIPTHPQSDTLNQGTPSNVISYISEIRRPGTGMVIGYAMANVEQNIFDSQLSGISLSENSNLVIIDNNKTIIFHSQPEYVSTQFRAGYMGDIFEQKKGSLIATENDTETIVAFTTSQTTGWTIIYTVPTDTIFQKINSLTYALVYMLIICIPVAVLIAAMVGSGLSQSISALRDRMKLAEGGEFEALIEVHSNDEIGELEESFNSMLERIKELIERVYQTEINRKAAELGALQAQINPHFLYNTLQVMDIMAEEKEAYEISEACQALSKVFRYSVRKTERVSLQEEIEHVENYVYIQKLRFGDRLDVSYQIQPEARKVEIIKLVIQPLVENAIVHGSENSVLKCSVSISAAVLQDTLTIIVDDTGIGMDEAAVERIEAEINAPEAPSAPTQKREGSGIALRNVNQRIKLQYGEQYGIYIKSKKFKGTRVLVTLPAKKYL